MSNRDALDRYYTPDSVAVKLVAAVPDLGARVHPLTILEPSCGGGAFMRALRLRWPDARISGVDVDPEAPMQDSAGVTITDFLTVREPVDLILGNPPFNVAEEHVRHALSLSRVGVGFLLRLAFLESTKREPFWKAHRPPRSLCCPAAHLSPEEGPIAPPMASSGGICGSV